MRHYGTKVARCVLGYIHTSWQSLKAQNDDGADVVKLLFEQTPFSALRCGSIMMVDGGFK